MNAMATPPNSSSIVQSNVKGFDDVVSDGFYTPHSAPSYSGIRTPVVTKTFKPRPGTPSQLSGRYVPNSFDQINCPRCGKSNPCHGHTPMKYYKGQTSELHSPHTASEVSPTRLLNTPDPYSQSIGTMNGHCEPMNGSRLSPSATSQYSIHKNNPDRWDAVKHVTETIIKEKDMLIERQKLKRLQLEQKISDLEERLRRTQISFVHSNTGRIDSQLEREERAYHQLSNSAQILSDNSNLAKVVFEKSQLERQLGEAEHEMANMKCSLLTLKSDHSQQLEYFQKQIDIRNLKEREDDERRRIAEMEVEKSQKEFSRLKHYLSELATKEEHEELVKSNNELKDTIILHEQTITKLRHDRDSLNRQCDDLMTELSESKYQIGQLVREIRLVSTDNDCWQQKENERLTANPDDIVALKEMNRQLAEQVEALETERNEREYEFEQTLKQVQTDMDSLNGRVEEQGEIIQNLESEGEEKQDEIRQLTEQLNEISEENSSLRREAEENQEQVETAQDIVCGESNKLQQRMVEEIIFCTNSLECLMELCANNQEMDLADMLALRPTPVTVSSPREYKTILEQQKDSLSNMSAKIEKLRQHIIDRYADDMASSGHIECATQ